MVTNITFHKITESIYSCKILEVTDDDGAIHLLIGLKYTVIMADTGSPVLTKPHFISLALCETKVPIKYRGGHTPLSLTRQSIFMYLDLFYKAFWWL